MKRYNSLNDYLKNKFNKKVYKLAIDCSFTCPNRDGTKGTGGCIFCSQKGSGDFAESGSDVKAQLEKAKQKLKNKVPQDAGYIAYFQSFTNTYADVKTLEKLYLSALEVNDVVALSVATRPDCINDENVALLSKINKTTPVFVELGLQTANENTAKYINRCYENDEFTLAVKKLREHNIEVVVHLILGLPNETQSDMLNTVDFINRHDIQGVKFQLLHVLENTALAKYDYTPLTMDEYFSVLGECINRLRPDIVIHRLTGDGDKKVLIAPEWSANKKHVLNSLNKYLEQNNIIQGQYATVDGLLF
ncbi:MAG: TIGR01212 family radical SAM protein [Acutalibacteraceae bacterium]|nr:TIGR01212 family radical SAM protein [Acutalibacteraceae bacterium]